MWKQSLTRSKAAKNTSVVSLRIPDKQCGKHLNSLGYCFRTISVISPLLYIQAALN